MQDSFHITLDKVGKKFYQRWLFKDLSLEFLPLSKFAVIGRNGSGKSTLMRIIAGQMSPSVGKLSYHINGKSIPADQMYQYISWSGPYLDLYPELNFPELLSLHFKFKPALLPDPNEIIQLLRLGPHSKKPLRNYSSGMLQRAKVGLALFTQSKVLMLDEPTSNMDTDNANRMLELIDTYLQDRIYILASNMEREYSHFDDIITLGK